MAESLFSPSWYRVARLTPRLRKHAQILRHEYRGQTWYVLQDLTSERFHRFSPSAYLIIGQMDGRHTVQDIWDNSPGPLGRRRCNAGRSDPAAEPAALRGRAPVRRPARHGRAVPPAREAGQEPVQTQAAQHLRLADPVDRPGPLPHPLHAAVAAAVHFRRVPVLAGDRRHRHLSRRRPTGRT